MILVFGKLEKRNAVLHKIVEYVPEEVLENDLEKYRQRAVKIGATDAKIINSSDIVIDERVVAKCMFPRCPVCGTNVNCPPYTPRPDQIRIMVNNFDYAIFFKLDGSAETLVGCDRDIKIKSFEIVSRIEAQAYYDGYYLALGFGGSSCKSVLCPEDDCSAIIAGQSCRHPLRGRPSMHAVGMDVFKMAIRAGWDIYPAGKLTPPSELPCVSHLGLILIY